MNQNVRRLNTDILWNGLGFLICSIVGAIFALDCLRIAVINQFKSIPDLGKMTLIALAIFSFIPGICTLGFYIFTDARVTGGVARGMSWWWIWLT
jgi:hypothetical protein